MRSGRVSVGGHAVSDPARDVGEDDLVTLDGAPLVTQHARVVYALNKPAGVVSTVSDPQGRPTVVSLVPSELRLYPVGRLDADATGLILLTNDGALSYRLTHPSFEVDKTYRVVVASAPVPEAALRALRAGVQLDDGPTAPARVVRVSEDTFELTIHEGRKRQVKRMCEQVGHPVLMLTRVRLGPLRLGELAPGAYRRLSPAEIDLLRDAGSGARRFAASSSAGRAQPPRASTPPGERPPGA